MLLDYITAPTLTYLLIWSIMIPTIHRFLGSDRYDITKATVVAWARHAPPAPQIALVMPTWDDTLPPLEMPPARWPATHLITGDDIVELVPAARNLCTHRETDPVTVLHPTKGYEVTWSVCKCGKAIKSDEVPASVVATRLDKAA